MANKNYSKTIISLGDSYTSTERKAIADDFIEYIRERTEKGHGVDDKRWKGSAANVYSDTYKDSFEFKSKSRKKLVSLILSGDMLSSIEKLPSGASEIAIGLTKSDPDYKKAEGNIRGSYGGKPNPAKERNFMELSKDEIAKILRPYKDAKTRQERVSAFKAALLLVKEQAKKHGTNESI